jgi:hypothetical protein
MKRITGEKVKADRVAWPGRCQRTSPDLVRR